MFRVERPLLLSFIRSPIAIWFNTKTPSGVFVRAVQAGRIRENLVVVTSSSAIVMIIVIIVIVMTA